MAAGEMPLPFAIKAVKTGLSARAGLKAFRAGGGSIKDATWFRTVAEVRRTLADSLEEATRPANRRPKGDEITYVSSAKQDYYYQHVNVFVQDKATGVVESRPFSLRGRGLLTRKAAMQAAMEAFEKGVTGSPDRFDETIIGATYTGTIGLIPRG